MRYFELTDYYDIASSSFVEPKNLSKKEIIEFLKDAEDEIVELINSTLRRNRDELISYIRNVKIKLEPKKVIKSKYSISYAEAIKPILDNPARYPRRFADDLKRIIDRNNENDGDFNLKRAIEGFLDEYDREDTLDDEKSKIRVWLLGDEVAATFRESGQGTITLYLKTISKCRDYSDYLFEVFAHEIFHAYHWFAVNNVFGCSWKYTQFQQDTVKEALASYIEHKYISNYNIWLSSELDECLSKIKMKHYPYSGYKHICNDGFFTMVFEESLDDLGEAYNLLIHEETCIKHRDEKNIFSETRKMVPLDLDDNESLIKEKAQHIIAKIKAYKPRSVSSNVPAYSMGMITSDQIRGRLSNGSEFVKLLFKKLAERNMKDSDLYKIALIDKSAYSKMISEKTKPSRKTVALLALALKLTSKEYEEFVEAAGYGISNETKDPISVVAICIEEGEYDIYELEPVIKEVTGEYLAYYGKDSRRNMVEVE